MSDQMGASVEVVRLSSYYGGYYWDIVWDGEQGCGGKKRGKILFCFVMDLVYEDTSFQFLNKA